MCYGTRSYFAEGELSKSNGRFKFAKRFSTGIIWSSAIRITVCFFELIFNQFLKKSYKSLFYTKYLVNIVQCFGSMNLIFSKYHRRLGFRR